MRIIDTNFDRFQEVLRRLDLFAGALQCSLENQKTSLSALANIIERGRSNVVTSEYGLLNPEVGLLQHLYPYLQSRNALDVGAHVGDVSLRLLETGYTVYAFEPCPPIYERLTSRLQASDEFHGFPVAVGPQDASCQLHIARDLSPGGTYKDSTLFSSLVQHSMRKDLVFTDAIEVPVRSVDSLVRSGDIPAHFGVIKIDTEGYDLEVLRGMSLVECPVVVTEFWDRTLPFGQSGALNNLADQVREMRTRGYLWYIVLYRIDGSYDISFYCNRPESLDNSWGNIVFVRDFEIFNRALHWCEATIPRTYFRA